MYYVLIMDENLLIRNPLIINRINVETVHFWSRFLTTFNCTID